MYAYLAILHPHILMPQYMFCLFGYMSASYFWALKVKDRRFLSQASMFMRAVNLQEMDVSSSTSWPIGFWDLEVNLGQSRPSSLRPLAALVANPLQSKPLLLRDIKLDATAGNLQWQRVVVAIYHPSLDLEMVGLLLTHCPERLQITLAFYPAKSLYTDSSMASHVCNEWPSLCVHPHEVTTLSEGSPPSADLNLCSVFWLCRDLEKWTQRKGPLLAFFGGAPVNSFHVRDGKTTVDEELEPVWGYLKRTETSAAPAVLVSDAPYTSELLHSYTGILLPVYRPVCPYLSDRWSPDHRGSVFIPKAISGTKSSALGWMVSMLKAFAEDAVGEVSSELGESPVAPLFALQKGFMSWKSMAAFKGVENPSDERNLERLQLVCHAFRAELRLVQDLADDALCCMAKAEAKADAV
eukprot:Skav208107  [mRNA]  locus=scaffold1681:292130:296382:- [translate_table: standard]